MSILLIFFLLNFVNCMQFKDFKYINKGIVEELALSIGNVSEFSELIEELDLTKLSLEEREGITRILVNSIKKEENTIASIILNKIDPDTIYKGVPLIVYAAIASNIAIVKELCIKGANIDKVSEEEYFVEIVIPQYRVPYFEKMKKVVTRIVGHKPKFTESICYMKGTNALIAASRGGIQNQVNYREIIEFLIAKGANVKVRDSINWSAANYLKIQTEGALFFQREMKLEGKELLQKLMEEGAEIGISNCRQEIPAFCFGSPVSMDELNLIEWKKLYPHALYQMTVVYLAQEIWNSRIFRSGISIMLGISALQLMVNPVYNYFFKNEDRK